MENTQPVRKKLQFPNTFVLLFGIAILVAIMSYIVPGGAFERVVNEATGRTVVVPGTFQYGASNPTTLMGLLTSAYRGFMETVDIFGMILVSGMCIGVVINSGAFQAGIGGLIRKFGQKTGMLIILLIVGISIVSSIVGIFDPLMVFIPVLIALCRSMHYDDMTAAAILILGCYGSFGFALFSPFSLVIAQSIAEVPIYSAMGLRTAGFVGAIILTIIYILWYARRCAKDHTKSLLYNKDTGGYIENCALIKNEKIEMTEFEMTGKRKIILLVMLVMTAILVVGVLKFGWYLSQMTALFLAVAVVVGFLENGLDYNKTANDFFESAKPLLYAGILMGMARAIVIILSDAQIIDTIIYWISIPLSKTNGVIAGWAMYISQVIINFFIPSSSGQAVVVMPILAPLGDLVGLPANVAVHAYMAGDSFGNLITPTHPMTLAVLGLCGIPWSKWFKFAWKVVVLYSLLTFVILTVGYFVW